MPMPCDKADECHRDAYRNGLCLPHIKGWRPAPPTHDHLEAMTKAQLGELLGLEAPAINRAKHAELVHLAQTREDTPA